MNLKSEVNTATEEQQQQQGQPPQQGCKSLICSIESADNSAVHQDTPLCIAGSLQLSRSKPHP
jgi:hypothetical protein